MGLLMRTKYLHGTNFHANATSYTLCLINQRRHKFAPLLAKAFGLLMYCCSALGML